MLFRSVVVADGPFAIGLRDKLVHAIRHGSHRVNPAQYASRPLRQRLLDRIAFGLMRMALFVTGNRY